LENTKTLSFLLQYWYIAEEANRFSDLNTTSTYLILDELMQESKLSDLSEASKISIVYAILFSMIFIDYIVYKLVRSKQKKNSQKINPDLIIKTNRSGSVIMELRDKFKRRFTHH